MFAALKSIFVPILIVLSGFLCIEFAFPIAVGEFLAGIIGGQILKPHEFVWIDFFSNLGLLSIMFIAGFEVDLPILKKNLKVNLITGTLSFMAPMSMVMIAGLAFDFSLKQAFVFGIALSTTSLAMVFSILKEHNVLQIKSGQVLLGSAMVVDVLSMLALGFLLFDYNAVNLLYMGVLIVVVFILKKFIISVFNRYQGNRAEFELKTLMLILPTIGLVGEAVGVHGAILAFTLGMILSDIDTEHEEIISKLTTVVFSLLAPIFFFHAGTLIQIDQLNFKTLGWIAVLGGIAISLKYAATYLSIYYTYRKSKVFARYAAILFNYRLSFGIVTAIYASDKGVINSEMVTTILCIVAGSSIISVILEKRMKAEEIVEGASKFEKLVLKKSSAE